MTAVKPWELSGTESVGDSAQDAARARIWANHKHYMKGFVTVAVDDDGPLGVVEHSFSMDCSRDAVRFWRVREDCYEGREGAEEYAKHFNQNNEKAGRDKALDFKVYDIDDPACPVLLDFERYERQAKVGGPNKFDTRNLRIVPIVRARLFFKGDDHVR